MGFKVTGNVGALHSYARSLRRLAQVPSQMAAPAAERISDLIDDQFSSGTDPYGAAWEAHAPATVARWGEHPVLELSGALRGSVDVQPMGGAGIAVTLDEVGQFHQTGTARMPARPILPVAGLPPSWEDALSQAAAETFERTLGGG